MCITTLRKEYCGKRTPTLKIFLIARFRGVGDNDNSFGIKGIEQKRGNEETGKRGKREGINDEVPITNDRQSVKEHLSAFGGKVAPSFIEWASGEYKALSVKQLCNGISGNFNWDLVYNHHSIKIANTIKSQMAGMARPFCPDYACWVL